MRPLVGFMEVHQLQCRRPDPGEDRQQHPARPLLLSLLAFAALCGCSPATRSAVSLVTAASTPASAPALSPRRPPSGAPDARAGAPDFTALMEKVGPAVVNIATSRTVPVGAASSGDPLLDYFRRFAPPGSEGREGREFRSQGVGSGFVVDAQGHVLTNAHVVADADQVSVRLPDSKREHKARVVGIDRQTDIALLKVDAEGLPVVTLGDSTQLKAGEWVAAIGSPFGLANTITAGIVSAKERSLPDETFVPFIQTDSPSTPQLRRPALNTRGESFGINSQIYSRTAATWACRSPSPSASPWTSRSLKTQGRVVRGRIGVTIQEIAPTGTAFKRRNPGRAGDPSSRAVRRSAPGSSPAT